MRICIAGPHLSFTSRRLCYKPELNWICEWNKRPCGLRWRVYVTRRDKTTLHWSLINWSIESLSRNSQYDWLRTLRCAYVTSWGSLALQALTLALFASISVCVCLCGCAPIQHINLSCNFANLFAANKSCVSLPLPLFAYCKSFKLRFLFFSYSLVVVVFATLASSCVLAVCARLRHLHGIVYAVHVLQLSIGCCCCAATVAALLLLLFQQKYWK